MQSFYTLPFHKVYIVKNKKGNKFKKNIHEYGVFSIRLSDSATHRQIMGWIYALFNGKILTTFRGSSTVEQETVKYNAALNGNVEE